MERPGDRLRLRDRETNRSLIITGSTAPIAIGGPARPPTRCATREGYAPRARPSPSRLVRSFAPVRANRPPETLSAARRARCCSRCFVPSASRSFSRPIYTRETAIRAPPLRLPNSRPSIIGCSFRLTWYFYLFIFFLFRFFYFLRFRFFFWFFYFILFS